MKQSHLALWLKGILGGTGVCGAAVYAYLLPFWGQELAAGGALSGSYWPWLIFLWLTALPCYAVLVYGWKIAGEIERDNSFCYKNARRLQRVAALAAGDTVFFFAGNLLLLALGRSHPGVAFLSCLVVFAGIAVSVAATVTSHLVYKAAALREENELTI
ncbi:MAG: DUF2975 domain-containing protein [Clostridiales bacterium]|nr:DUF2975 domain-containing protein [Clostridiales bacterium]